MKIFALLVLLCVGASEGANILGIFDIPSKSIHILGHVLMAGLARRGHNVTMISGFPVKESIHNYTHIAIEELLPFKEETLSPMLRGDTKFGMLNVIKCQQKVIELALSTKTFQDFLKSDSKFDLIIQLYIMNEAFLGLAHLYDAPVIGYIPISGFPHINELTGNPSPPSYVPVSMAPFSQDMGFFQRVANTFMTGAMMGVHRFFVLPNQRALLNKYFPDAPSVEELRERVNLVMINSHVSTESPRPYVPNIIQIGGYHIQEPELLSPDLKKLLDDSTQGVLFFSFGSNVHTNELPQKMLDAFKKKLGELKLTVVWTYGDSDYRGKPKNVFPAKWYPQRGILAHPNVKAFITHGGAGSMTEALYFGVPLLCINFFGDQQKNCHEAASYGYGIHLEATAVTESTFSSALDELLNDHKYQQSAKFRSELFREQPMKPMDKAVFWIEHVLKYRGAKHLKPKSATMPLYQYLLLDVFAFLAAVVLIVLATLYLLLRLLLRKLWTKATGRKEKEKKN